MSDPVSPLAPSQFPTLPDVAGVRIATAETGMKYQGRDDVLLVDMAPGTSVAGVYTKSRAASAPVDWCRKSLKGGGGEAQALIVNAGNANAFTGQNGADSVTRTVEAVAGSVTCRPSRVFAASTGVIGEDLPDQMIVDQLGGMVAELHGGDWETAAKAIMTTDTFAKGAGCTTKIGDQTVNIAGIAKGSGMIAPDMATMLSFVFTDAKIPADILQELLYEAVGQSFNCITVDSDTSTSDTLMLFATGAAGEQPVLSGADDPQLAAFREALSTTCRELSHLVVRDGEGATKFITVNMSGAEDNAAARRIALSVANSPLVKTAIAGEDANWGRIVMAVGKAGEQADRDALKIIIGGVAVAENGRAVEGYDEAPVAAHMTGANVDIDVDVGIGDGTATVWTCDLTHGYIEINADYRS
ncbi:MAG: bifunctional glutamate N-acetyltransferase/amino-acid acetyltransferase ArgJ [Rhodospirillales bacterium]|jgi:glutamate N-acetyltransferase / amino-acid N-acetyltransferase|nr:bifunctional glutamate N-acetyltransferase/amino-acid acetyltransferase ArgJ [Rhodospirillales bacterium]MBT4626877.1 bifunctional glutamate N-acetyltransferase/amino-acid acetyltransferase ArgJ [Rhodospirillales bacterium]MBT5350461.1 bifunctional glutamate N-acetyltransferase/amino-acid acetyltransferase ArgJ [Rhodospirillales bacterium]MBT5519681.1 bifunctional glutamate N-acetyltransferase/amino-acid acetyltransferase ArgJ [Rhodospirillales bacterium]MBT7146499.1 bifunctional glutamate N